MRIVVKSYSLRCPCCLEPLPASKQPSLIANENGALIFAIPPEDPTDPSALLHIFIERSMFDHLNQPEEPVAQTAEASTAFTNAGVNRNRWRRHPKTPCYMGTDNPTTP